MNKEIEKGIPIEPGKNEDETLPETHIRTQALLARQKRLEQIQQERDSFVDLKELAEFETKQAEIFVSECKNILRKNLADGVKTEWASLYHDKPYPPFVYKNPAPRYKQIAREIGVPQKRFFSELLFPSAKKARLQKENDARKAYHLREKQYEEEKEAERAAHEKEREAYVAGQSAYNSMVEALQFNFEKGHPAAIESFTRIVLNGIKMPDPINVYFDAVYLPEEAQLVIDCLLPAYYDLPHAVSYQYNKQDLAIAPIAMDEQEYDAFYLDLIRQITLTAINTVFNAIPARRLQWVGFNGWVENDKIEDTLDTKACVISCRAARDVFTALDLSNNSPAHLMQELQALTAKTLTGTDTVQPIVSTADSSGADEKEQVSDVPGGRLKPPWYRPGELRQVTTQLVEEMMEQIENNLLKTDGNKNKIIH
ncbi:MAG: hypothetical protein PHP51_07850 [Desulfotomaculaceae bacterium]|nr:hypothetical protein [Desulfotomaculaceae bacterium]MDD4766721.1 hypothetical protein [Desulfotomaculaceae bacterium]